MRASYGVDKAPNSKSGRNMITGLAVAGDIVKHYDGRAGLVIAWVGQDDAREVAVVLRGGPGEAFQRRWFPMKMFQENFTLVGKIEEVGK
jgi:hypothetical protein